MTLFDYYLRYMTEVWEGTRPAPEGITLPEGGDENARIQALGQQLQAMGMAEFVRACAAQDGTEIPQSDYDSFDPAELNAAIDALAPRIPQLKKELETAQSSQKELDAALSQLDKAQSQLETGKLELSQQLILATLQLQQAEQALDEAEEQFRQQRDAAYKAAGLDGILTQSAVSQLLMAQNFSMPAGYIEGGEGDDNRYIVKVGDTFDSADTLKSICLLYTSPSPRDA